MNRFIYIIAFAILPYLYGCSETIEDKVYDSQDIVESFVVYTADTEYHADIDNKEHQITVGGLEYSEDIVRVEISFADGYKLLNDISYESWQVAQEVIVTHKYGHSLSYSLTIPKLTEKLNEDFVVMGYITPSRNSFDEVFPQINLYNLTHLLACFARVQEDGSLELSGLTKMNELIAAARRHNIKILVSLRDYQNHSFTKAIANAESRTRLVTQVINYVQANGLDGFDVDFEDYAYIDTAEGRSNLLAFSKELREATPEGILMTCAVSPYPYYSDQWAQYYDFINIMSYDAMDGRQHASYGNFVWHIDYVRSRMNAPISKLVGGVPFYGYSWDTIPGKDGSGTVSYNSILNFFTPELASQRDQMSETYYNGEPTIRRKCEYAKSKGMGGIMIWELMLDTTNPEYRLLDIVGEEMLSDK